MHEEQTVLSEVGGSSGPKCLISRRVKCVLASPPGIYL
jgi:hypothetical protein